MAELSKYEICIDWVFQHGYFFVNFAKLLKDVFYRTPPVAASSCRVFQIIDNIWFAFFPRRNFFAGVLKIYIVNKNLLIQTEKYRTYLSSPSYEEKPTVTRRCKMYSLKRTKCLLKYTKSFLKYKKRLLRYTKCYEKYISVYVK